MVTLFPVSGVEAPVWAPLVAGFAVSFFTSMAGVSGAVLLLPFQMSVLGFVSPAVSPTNLVFNIVAIPSGIYRYWRERRLVAPLAWIVVAGGAPGVVVGEWMRVTWLPDPGRFKIFVACVLLFIGVRLIFDARRVRRDAVWEGEPALSDGAYWAVQKVAFDRRHLVYEFQGRQYRCGTLGVLLVSLVVGLIGGVYGIGGGAILAPFFVALYGLSVHTVAGATLMGTFLTSVVGVTFAELIAPQYRSNGVAVAPDWLLGGLFGSGGFAGMYLGARVQRFVPAFWLQVLLAAVLFAVSSIYLAAPLLEVEP
jgi:hypothetical protein